MSMPKATVNEDYFAQPRKYQVRFARKIFAMQTIAVAQGKNQSTNDQFRRRILTFDRAHDPAACLGVFFHLLRSILRLGSVSTTYRLSATNCSISKMPIRSESPTLACCVTTSATERGLLPLGFFAVANALNSPSYLPATMPP